MTLDKPSKKKASHLGHGEWIRKEKRYAIYLRDDWKCLYCLADLKNLADGQEVTLDHISETGGNHESNLVTSCKVCNTGKAGYSIESFASKDARKRIAKAIATPLDIRAARSFLHASREKKDAFRIPVAFAPPSVAAHYLQTTDKMLFQLSTEGVIDPPTEQGYEIFKTLLALYLNAKSRSLGELDSLKLQKLRDEVAKGQVDLMKSAGELVPLEWSRQLFAHLAISVRNIIMGSDLEDAQKIDLIGKVKKINADDYLAQLRSQTVDAVGDEPEGGLPDAAIEGRTAA